MYASEATMRFQTQVHCFNRENLENITCLIKLVQNKRTHMLGIEPKTSA